MAVNSAKLTLPVRFQGALDAAARNALKPGRSHALFRTFDFDVPGISTVTQNKLMYALVISSRVVAAALREMQAGGTSFNEAREHAVRDVMGWVFWFYASTQLRHVFARFLPKDIQQEMIRVPKMEKPAEGLLGTLKREANFIFRGSLTSTDQLEQRQKQLLTALRESASELGLSSQVLAEKESVITKRFGKLIKLRSLASATGIGVAIALLGIGIPLLNILMTRANNAKRHGAEPGELGVPTPPAMPAPQQQPMPFPYSPPVGGVGVAFDGPTGFYQPLVRPAAGPFTRFGKHPSQMSGL